MGARRLNENATSELGVWELLKDRDFKELDKALDYYCPFRAMGTQGHELRHGAFLANLLQPEGDHRTGAAFLRDFLVLVSQIDAGIDGRAIPREIDIYLDQLADASVKREWKNIDLLIMVPSLRWFVVVELKVNASQGQGQLRKYRKTADDLLADLGQGWRYSLVFLTKNYEEPAGDETNHWSSINLADLLPSLDQLGSSQAGDELARLMVRAYAQMLRREHLEDDRIADLASKLWARHEAALTLLLDQRPDPRSEMLEQISSESDTVVARLFEETKEEWLAEENSKKGALFFALRKWDELDGFRTSQWTESGRLVLLVIDRRSAVDEITVRLLMGPGDGPERNLLRDAITEAGASQRAVGSVWATLAKEDVKITADDAFDTVLQAIARMGQLAVIKYDPIVSGTFAKHAG